MRYRICHGRRWSPDDDDRLRALIQGGAAVPAIARAMGRSATGVIARARREGLVLNKRVSCLTGRETLS